MALDRDALEKALAIDPDNAEHPGDWVILFEWHRAEDDPEKRHRAMLVIGKWTRWDGTPY